jgi:uncharacterized protein YggU (UPF0235/DUF167 family)
MYITVSVRAGVKKESMEQISDSRFKISVKEPAERNLANGRVRALIAAHFKIASARVRILGGHHATSKFLSVDIQEPTKRPKR